MNQPDFRHAETTSLGQRSMPHLFCRVLAIMTNVESTLTNP